MTRFVRLCCSCLAIPTLSTFADDPQKAGRIKALTPSRKRILVFSSYGSIRIIINAFFLSLGLRKYPLQRDFLSFLAQVRPTEDEHRNRARSFGVLVGRKKKKKTPVLGSKSEPTARPSSQPIALSRGETTRRRSLPYSHYISVYFCFLTSLPVIASTSNRGCCCTNPKPEDSALDARNPPPLLLRPSSPILSFAPGWTAAGRMQAVGANPTTREGQVPFGRSAERLVT